MGYDNTHWDKELQVTRVDLLLDQLEPKINLMFDRLCPTCRVGASSPRHRGAVWARGKPLNRNRKRGRMTSPSYLPLSQFLLFLYASLLWAHARRSRPILCFVDFRLVDCSRNCPSVSVLFLKVCVMGKRKEGALCHRTHSPPATKRSAGSE